MSYIIISFSLFLAFKLKKIHTVFYTIIASSLFQFLIVFFQFLKQRSVGLSVEFTREITQHFTGLDEVNTFFRVNGTYMYHNQLALVTTIFFSILIIKGLYSMSKKKLPNIYLIAALMNLFVIIFTQTRAMWIALPFIFLTIFLFDRSRLIVVKFLLKYINKKILIATLLLMLLIVLPRINNSFVATTIDSGIGIRSKMIKEGLVALEASPYIGYGIATNEYVLFSQFPMGVMSVFPAAIHMAFLQLALESGIIGLILFILPFIYILRKIILEKNKSMYSLIYLCAILTVSFYYLLQPHVLIMESQYLGIILGFGIIALNDK